MSKWAECRTIDSAGKCGELESTRPVEHKRLQDLTAGIWAQYGGSFQFSKKSQISIFILNFLCRTGQRMCMQVDICQLPDRLQPPLKCMFLISLTAAIIIAPVA